MEDEKSFKEKQLKSSETTMRRLNQDKEKRLQELEKINTLDEKVQTSVWRVGGISAMYRNTAFFFPFPVNGFYWGERRLIKSRRLFYWGEGGGREQLFSRCIRFAVVNTLLVCRLKTSKYMVINRVNGRLPTWKRLIYITMAYRVHCPLRIANGRRL